MKITLVRHGEVEEAYIGKYNGHNGIGLSQKGKQDAQKLAEIFKCKKFERVYCSDLKRTRETLAPFIQAKDAIFTAKLREKSWGKHEGLSFDEITAQGIEYKNFSQWIEALDGESSQLYVQRIKDFFFKELLLEDAENILLITHAGVIRVFMAIVQKLPLEEAFSINIPYTSYIVYDTNLKAFNTLKS